MNVYTAIGRAGKDAETRFTPNGKQVTSWSMAIDSGYGDAKQTLWLDCSAWGERFGKVGEYIKKGSQVCVSGELGTREHEGKTYLKLRIAELTLCGGKPAEPQAQSKPQKGKPAPDLDTDEIPF